MDVKIEERLVGHVRFSRSSAGWRSTRRRSISKTRSTASFRRTVFISFWVPRATHILSVFRRRSLT